MEVRVKVSDVEDSFRVLEGLLNLVQTLIQALELGADAVE